MKGIRNLIVDVIVCIAIPAFAIDNVYVEGPYMAPEGQLPGWVDNLYFEVWKGGLELTSPLYYEDDKPGRGGVYGGEVIVPEKIFIEWEGTEVEVVSIAGFYRNGATVLRLPETIREINNTIRDCKLLEEVYLNDNLKELNGVIDCPKLSICPLPQSLEYVGDCFMSGLALKNIEFPPLLKTIGNKTFSRNYSLETLSLGNLVVAGDSCFNNLPLLKEVVLPESLESLGNGCFNYCWKLEKVVIPESLERLGNGCFSYCTNLEKVTLPSHPTDIPANCFRYNNVKELTIYAEQPYLFQDYMSRFFTCPYPSELNAVLYVPDGSVDLYKEADKWNWFNIRPMSESGVDSVAAMPKGWSANGESGKLVIKSDSRRRIDVYDLSGAAMATSTREGKSEFPLRPGVYTVTSNGESVKVVVK